MIFGRLVEAFTAPITFGGQKDVAPIRSVMGPPGDIVLCNKCDKPCLVGECPMCGERVEP